MQAEIVKQDKDVCLIQWKSEKGFGQLKIQYNNKGKFIVDTEYMSIEHMFEVIKAIK